VKPDPMFKRAVIERFNHSPRTAKDPYAFAMLCIYEVKELFRAINDDGKPKERVESDRTREIQVELNRLNKKVE
jgi:hypothetical protein